MHSHERGLGVQYGELAETRVNELQFQKALLSNVSSAVPPLLVTLALNQRSCSSGRRSTKQGRTAHSSSRTFSLPFSILKLPGKTLSREFFSRNSGILAAGLSARSWLWFLKRAQFAGHSFRFRDPRSHGAFDLCQKTSSPGFYGVVWLLADRKWLLRISTCSKLIVRTYM